jgi:hypothetical protein
MSGKGEDRAQGFAKPAVAGSAAHPSQSSPDHQEQGDRTTSHRSLTGDDRRGTSDTPDPDRPTRQDRYKP